MQSESPNLHCLTSELVALYKSLLSCYMTNTYIRSTTIEKIDLTSRVYMLPLTLISLGHTVASLLAIAMTAEVRGFLEHCQNLLIKAAIQIKTRFPISDPILH